MTNRAAGLTSAIVAASIAAVLIGGQVLASAGPAAPRHEQPVPAAKHSTSDDDDDPDAGDCAEDACGNAHSKAVHAWVACKAVHGKDACVKPPPPGEAHGHIKHAGTAPGPASANGHGHGWGRAHAPGQLTSKQGSDDPAD